MSVFPFPVPTFPEEGGQPAARDAAEEEEVQEQDHPGLQDPGCGDHQHVPGEQDGGGEREFHFY